MKWILWLGGIGTVVYFFVFKKSQPSGAPSSYASYHTSGGQTLEDVANAGGWDLAQLALWNDYQTVPITPLPDGTVLKVPPG